MRKILYGEESKIKDNLKKYLFVEPIYGIIIVTQRRVQGRNCRGAEKTGIYNVRLRADAY